MFSCNTISNLRCAVLTGIPLAQLTTHSAGATYSLRATRNMLAVLLIKICCCFALVATNLQFAICIVVENAFVDVVVVVIKVFVALIAALHLFERHSLVISLLRSNTFTYNNSCCCCAFCI